MSGWDLIQAANALISDFWTLTRSQVYRELGALEHAGLIRAGEPGPRDRQPYRLTAAGRAAFRAWIDTEPPAEQIRYPLLLRIAFGAHLDPKKLGEFVATHRAVHERRLDAYRTRRSKLAPDDLPYLKATLDFGIRYEAAVLDWFAHLPKVLDLGPRHHDVPHRTAARRPPPGFRTVTPRIVVDDAPGQVEFLRAVFGGIGEVEQGRPAEIRIGDSLVMVTPADERATFPAFLYVYVDDADSTHRLAVEAGAKTLEEPRDTPYGDRRAMVRDPFGNVFQIAHRITTT
jgi:uncharacterized glyoxalase superfamily protein PhnB/DNA-binding PadR family transcriptional regulator